MSESAHQQALFQWAAVEAHRIPALRMLYAIPNGGHRHKATAAKLKREGVKKGMLDVCLPVRVANFGALYIELKRPAERGKPKGRLSESQEQWLGDLQAYGQCAGVCYGWEEARALILAYLKGEDA